MRCHLENRTDERKTGEPARQYAEIKYTDGTSEVPEHAANCSDPITSQQKGQLLLPSLIVKKRGDSVNHGFNSLRGRLMSRPYGKTVIH